MSVLHPKPTEKAFLAYRMAMMLSTPKPKYPSGGVVCESRPGMACTDDRFKDAKIYIKPE